MERKGYDQDQLYFAIGGAEVNPHNFNLVMSFDEAAGFRTPVDGGLSMSLRRVYNSQFYSESNWRCQWPCTDPFQTEPLEWGTDNSLYPLETPQPGYSIKYLKMTRMAPMGLGWQFHLGRIYKADIDFDNLNSITCYDNPATPEVEPPFIGETNGWTYVSPDGAEHVLIRHPGESDGSPDPTPGYSVYYSYDGSMIRALEDDATGFWEVYLADGRIVEMQHTVTGVPFQEHKASRACDEATDENDDYFYFGRPDNTGLDCSLVDCVYDFDKVGLADEISGLATAFYTSRIKTHDSDSQGNATAFFDVTYHQAPFDYILAKLSDSHNLTSRDIDVVINSTDDSVPSYGHVTEIRYPCPPNASCTGTGGTAAFTYEYDTITLDISEIGSTSTSPQTLDVLTQVTAPGDYRTKYTYREPAVADPGDQWEDFGAPDWGGQIETIQYPSGKLAKFTFDRSYRLLAQMRVDANDNTPNDCNPCFSGKKTESYVLGVHKKEEFDDGTDDGNPDREWNISQEYVNTLPGPEFYVDNPQLLQCSDRDSCQTESRRFNVVVNLDDPAGNRTAIEFDTSTIEGVLHEAEKSSVYGKPIRETVYKTTDDASANRIRETTRGWTHRAKSLTQGFSWATQGWEKVHFLDDDPIPAPASNPLDAFDTETRPLDPDDNKPYLLTVNHDWVNVGLSWGAYQRSTVTGSAISNDPITEHTDYLFDNPSCTDAIRELWMPNLVTSHFVTTGNDFLVDPAVQRTDVAYDLTKTGRMTALAQREAPDRNSLTVCAQSDTDLSAATKDLVTTLAYDEQGNPTKLAKRFGPSASSDFSWTLDYAFGVLASQANDGLYDSGAEEHEYNDFFNTVDPATSLITKQEYYADSLDDPDAITRTIEYDQLRRPIEEQIGQMEPWEILYTNAASASGGNRLEKITITQGSGDQEITTAEHYDTVGRLFKSERLVDDPAGTTPKSVYRYVDYDSANRKIFESEWTDSVCQVANQCRLEVDGTVTGYTFGSGASQYEDPLGRPALVTGTLGEETIFEYFGTNVQTTVKDVSGATSAEGLVDAVTTHYKDGLDRLRLVDSPIGADAIYDYDQNGSLTKVNLVASVALVPTATDRYATSNPDDQVRTFEFDSLGRQFRATHPENGTEEVLAWNALGAPQETRDALGTARGHLHRTVYDSVGRAIRSERVLTNSSTEIDETHSPGAANWGGTGWNVETSSPCLDGATGWYMGNASNCLYAQGEIESADLVSTDIPASGVIEPGTTLSFDLFREVRNGVGQTSSRDEFIVEVRDATASDWSSAEEIYRIDSTQISWSRWQRTPALSLEAWIGKRIQIRFRFDSVDDQNNTSAAGIGIGDVHIQRPAVLILAETEYDDDFGVIDNKARGQVSQVLTHDEATQAWTNRTKYFYTNDRGQLSAAEQSLDWDRSGTLRDFVSTYEYDTLGRLFRRTLPHKPTDIARTVDYSFRHGQMAGIASTYNDVTADIVPGDSVDSGFLYHPAGGLQSVAYGNGTSTTISPNAAYLPDSIAVTKGTGTLWQTGQYSYDGARNITGIGTDSYWYDKAGRLTEALVHTSAGGMHPDGLGIAYTYDLHGNMTDRVTSYNGGTGTPPNRMAFSGRTFITNRNQITDTGYAYDENGNMLEEPTEDGIVGKRYRFDAQNRLPLVQSLTSGTLYQQAQYDASGDRWVRQASADRGGEARLTLRGIGGLVESEIVFRDALSQGEEDKHYIRGDSQLLAIHSRCGPAPTLSILPSGTAGRADFIIGLPLGATPTGSHIVTAEDDFGNTLSFTVPQTFTNFYKLDSQLLSGHQILRVKLELECGETGYSNAVSYTPEPTPPSCMTSMAVSHSDFLQIAGQPNRSTLMMMANDNNCATGTAFNLYYREEGASSFTKIAGPITAKSEYEMLNTPIGVGRGEYFFREYFPATKQEGNSGAIAINQVAGSSGGSGGIPGQGNWKTDYVHWDHLGSTRAITDEMGIVVSEMKFYPFGAMAEQSGTADSRLKFTGHERDDSLSIDYMKARSTSTAIGRFLSVDPVAGTANNPQSWNGYPYVLNNPIANTDPTGRVAATPLTGGPMFEQSQFAAGSAVGVIEGLVQGVSDAINAAFHPISTASSLASAVAHPFQTAGAIYSSGVQTYDDFVSAPTSFEQGKIAGRAASGLLAAAAGTKGVDKLAKLSAMTKASGAASLQRQATRFVAGEAASSTVDLAPTLSRMRSGQRFPHRNDGSVFNNREGRLPTQPSGYYREFVVPTPGVRGPGARRIVGGQSGELFYTPDHYRNFISIN